MSSKKSFRSNFYFKVDHDKKKNNKEVSNRNKTVRPICFVKHQENIKGKRGKLGVLAGICEFHLIYF